MKRDRRKLFEQLRTDHPVFIFEEFSYAVINNELRIEFVFSFGEKYFFKPSHIFQLPENYDENLLSDSLFRNIIFNLGMVEMISYWKAACSPRVVVKAACLTSGQISFWKKLYLYGLGEFFHTNEIIPGPDLMEIVSEGEEVFTKQSPGFISGESVLVPIGGGKDSVVTLELLSAKRQCVPYIMNPRAASLQTVAQAGYAPEDMITSGRTIDKKLLELNDNGYLNGHTPFSAMLAFTTVLVACINGVSEIALSNESSANEPTIPGTKINHQYSKSMEFEEDFTDYLHKYITEDIRYYSFLRPLNELQIAKLFASFPNHHHSFRSCNVGSKTDTWCGKCPKCLFTFIILSPFIEMDILSGIFGKNLFEDESLKATLDQLTGVAKEKPFECIGTIDEVNAALQKKIEGMEPGRLPVLLKHYREQSVQAKYSGSVYDHLLHGFAAHNIPRPEDVLLLKETLNV
ncbi:MAG: hypothetical protein ABFS05_06635 [Bacteroidota bacterium]